MTFTLLLLLAVGLALALAGVWHRRADLVRQQQAVDERAENLARPDAAAPLQVPSIDLQRCLGCGTCVRACPEHGVLALVHGQAAVVNGAACVGHAVCVAECPVGAVTLVAGDATRRTDVPVLDAELRAVGAEGLFLAGEVTARALIRRATEQGAAVAAAIVRERATRPQQALADGELDVVVVGAGPAGLACSLACSEHGLVHVLLDQETVVGGTVAKYPRHKLVLTDAVSLPRHGRLARREYGKEELVALWQELATRHGLPFRGGVAFERVERRADGRSVVHTSAGPFVARHVVLAVGRRGQPRRLGVSGEDLPHVTYALLDAASHAGCHAVVVGGGDSAVEAALALAEQPGTHVTVVYRQGAFFRLRQRNRERIATALAAGRVEALFHCEVRAIGEHSLDVVPAAAGGGGGVVTQLRADRVFVLIGGEPPFAALQRSGVSFDAESVGAGARPSIPAVEPAARGPWVWAAGLAVVLAALGFLLWHAQYYFAPAAVRAAEPLHATLRPDHSVGLGFGFAALGAVLVNLLYLARRRQWWGLRVGSLGAWMDVHVVAGIAAFVGAALHAALAPRATVGGQAFWALAILLATGAVGRWFYSWLPRAANGRELELDAMRAELQALVGNDPFAERARAEVLALIARRQWRSTWIGRVVAMVGLQWDLWATLRRLRRVGREQGTPHREVEAALDRTRQAHALAVAAAHLEDLRVVLGTWRWLHRWLALAMVLLVLAHVVVATLHGAFAGGGA
ncbi:MAG: NAD(P)-binding domain-containing protein [Planctomycetes bacterium]|nr:NAD(P)-binding domain-containing protein [Planctomycetota bacterium]